MPTDTILTWPDYRDEPRSNPAYILPRGVTDYGDYLRHYYQQVQGRPAPSVPTGTLPEAVAEVNCGRWIWQCPACGTGLPLQGGSPVICPACGTGGWHEVAWPANLSDIEAELLKQPGRRLIAPVRMWKPGWTMEDLKDRTQAAALLVAQGARLVRALSIGATRTWTLGEVPTASNFNTYISDPIDDLSGDNGPIELRDSLRVLDGTGGDRYVRLPSGTTGQRPGSPADGTLRWNTTDGAIDIRESSAWRQVLDSAVVTRDNLNTNGDVGTGATQVSAGDHTHTPVTSVPTTFSGGYTGSAGSGAWQTFKTQFGPTSVAGQVWVIPITEILHGSSTIGTTALRARWRMKIDGTVIYTAPRSTVPGVFGCTDNRRSITHNPTAGTHTIVLEGYRVSTGTPGGSIQVNAHVVVCSLT